MALKTLANGTVDLTRKTLYTAPVSKWVTINCIQIVNKAGQDIYLDLNVRNRGSTAHLTPDGFILKTGHKLEFDQPIGLHPGGTIEVISGKAGSTYLITGEERLQE